MQKRQSLPSIKFPLGTLEWPYLNAPDTKFNAAGEYKTNLRLPKEDVEEIVKLLEKYRDEFADAERERLMSTTGPNAGKAKAQAKQLTLKPVVTPAVDDEGNETGEVIFKTIRRAFKDKKTNKMVLVKPVLVDSKRNPITEQVWGGSKALVNAVPFPYVLNGSVGVSLRLMGTQVTELVTGDGSQAASRMFDEEDGFESTTADSDNPEDTSQTSTDAVDTDSGDEDWA